MSSRSNPKGRKGKPVEPARKPEIPEEVLDEEDVHCLDDDEFVPLDEEPPKEGTDVDREFESFETKDFLEEEDALIETEGESAFDALPPPPTLDPEPEGDGTEVDQDSRVTDPRLEAELLDEPSTAVLDRPPDEVLEAALPAAEDLAAPGGEARDADLDPCDRERTDPQAGDGSDEPVALEEGEFEPIDDDEFEPIEEGEDAQEESTGEHDLEVLREMSREATEASADPAEVTDKHTAPSRDDVDGSTPLAVPDLPPDEPEEFDPEERTLIEDESPWEQAETVDPASESWTEDTDLGDAETWSDRTEAESDAGWSDATDLRGATDREKPLRSEGEVPAFMSSAVEAEPLPGAGQTRVDGAANALDAKTQILGQDAGQEEDRPYLVIVQGEEEGREILLVGPALTIGRGPDNDLVLPDIACSRRHAIIERHGDGFLVTDLGSGNGTLVNGERVPRAELRDEDEIEVGNTVMQFFDPGAAPALHEDDEDLEPYRPEATPPPGRAFRSAQAGHTVRGEGFLTTLTADPRNKKIALYGGAAFGVLLLILIITKLSSSGEEEARLLQQQQAMEKEKKFKAHMEAAAMEVKKQNWQAAQIELQIAAGLKPEDALLKRYLREVKDEMSASTAIASARGLIDSKDYKLALTVLNQIKEDSQYFEDAKRLKQEIQDKTIDDLLMAGRELMVNKQYELAKIKFKEALTKAPERNEIKEILDEVEAEIAALERNRPRPVRVRRPRPVRKPESTGKLTGQILQLYRNAEIDRAISKAEMSGETSKLVLLKKFKGAFEQGRRLASNPGQYTKAIASLKAALKLDQQISGGTGSYHGMIKSTLAKVHFVSGVDAYTGKRLPKAYTHFTAALRYDPNLSQARENLTKLDREAKKLYEEAYIIKGSNVEKAIQNLEIAIKITDKKNIYYRKSIKLLSRLKSPGLGATGVGGDGF
ncbi:MAG: FHA domain-containing protein [Deltaproteobacteria bacterium]|nr:FHA domain-containing protein [Deltaproteobacteria bacterium]